MHSIDLIEISNSPPPSSIISNIISRILVPFYISKLSLIFWTSNKNSLLKIVKLNLSYVFFNGSFLIY